MHGAIDGFGVWVFQTGSDLAEYLQALVRQLDGSGSGGCLEPRDPPRGLIRAVFSHSGQAQVIGVTGPPGTGKSTLVNELAKEFIKRGRKVGIVAVDPSSPFTGGAVLGDRVRMKDLSGDTGVFIRSMASRGSVGGIAQTTASLAQIFDAAIGTATKEHIINLPTDHFSSTFNAHIVQRFEEGIFVVISQISSGWNGFADLHAHAPGEGLHVDRGRHGRQDDRISVRGHFDLYQRMVEGEAGFPVELLALPGRCHCERITVRFFRQPDRMRDHPAADAPGATYAPAALDGLPGLAG